MCDSAWCASDTPAQVSTCGDTVCAHCSDATLVAPHASAATSRSICALPMIGKLALSWIGTSGTVMPPLQVPPPSPRSSSRNDVRC